MRARPRRGRRQRARASSPPVTAVAAVAKPEHVPDTGRSSDGSGSARNARPRLVLPRPSLYRRKSAPPFGRSIAPSGKARRPRDRLLTHEGTVRGEVVLGLMAGLGVALVAVGGSRCRRRRSPDLRRKSARSPLRKMSRTEPGPEERLPESPTTAIFCSPSRGPTRVARDIWAMWPGSGCRRTSWLAITGFGATTS